MRGILVTRPAVMPPGPGLTAGATGSRRRQTGRRVYQAHAGASRHGSWSIVHRGSGHCERAREDVRAVVQLERRDADGRPRATAASSLVTVTSLMTSGSTAARRTTAPPKKN